MDLVSPIIDIVKTVGRPAWNYLKTQIHFKDKLDEFNRNRGNLLQLRSIVQSRLDAQLTGRTIARDDVETWLKQADEEMSRQGAEDEVNQSGCLSCFKRTGIVGKRTAELMKVCEDGGKFTQENYYLVVDDYSRILADDMATFLGWKKKLQGKHEDITATLNFQLCSMKIRKEQVENWLKEVEDLTGPVASDVEDQVRSGSPSALLVNLLQEKTREMKELYDGGCQLPENLVLDDYPRILADEMMVFRGWKSKLQGMHQDIMGRLNFQLRSMKIKKKQVENWLAEVEKITGHVADDVEEKVSSGDSSQYAFLATLLQGKIEEMKELYNEGGLFPETLVIDDPSTSAPELPTTKLEGSDAVKEELLKCLIGKEVTKLGVWGMGGVGKTTIMEHVYNQMLKESKFKRVIFVTVSQTFDVLKIQQEIANGLKENLQEHQDKRLRAATLSKMLEAHRPYVIILDDVWRSFELKEVGIPDPLVDDGCKLVLTTRSVEVVRQMACKEIKVNTLSQEASLNLFLNEVGDVAKSKHGDIGETLEQIVCECGGLPLAIKTVAGSMKGISNPRLWRTALNQLKQGRRNVAGTENDKFCVLKFSYDWLKDEIIQNCFLYCAMYPEDYLIPEEELIEYWIDEEIIDMMETRQATLDEGYAILNKLLESCLLERGPSIFGKPFVKLHDLFRDMAIHISRSSSPRFFVKAGVGLREIPEDSEWKDFSKVSLMHNRIEEIPPAMHVSKYPMLTTLLLSGGQQNFSTIPEVFFHQMPELKVLDLSYNEKLRSLPNSISKLVKLTTLKLRDCSSLKKVPSLSNLRLLKKLDLRGTWLEEVPQGLEMLSNLMYLVIYGSNESGILLSEALPNLPKLQYLFISEGIQLKRGAVGSLCKLELFYGQLSTVHEMSILFKTSRERLRGYCVFIGDSNFPDFSTVVGKAIYLGAIDICGEPNLLPLDVKALNIRSCNDVKRLNDVPGFLDAQSLEKCVIGSCEGMEYVFSRFDRLPEIKGLNLENLKNLEGLYEEELTLGKEASPPLGIFSSLQTITIFSCPKVKKLPAILHLQNLHKLSVHDCKQLEEIMVFSSEERISCKAILPNLLELELRNLPMLRYICGPNAALMCGSLNRISINRCPSLEMECLLNLRINSLQNPRNIFLDEVGNLKFVFDEDVSESLSSWTHPPATTSFYFSVERCPQLKKIFPSVRLSLDYFQKAMVIRVENCDELEEIIPATPEEEQESLKIIPAPELEMFCLLNLPKLKKFCSSTSGLLIGDSFWSMSIVNCGELKRIPLYLPQSDNGQLYAPPNLRVIEVSTRESWESLEWDQPDAKNILLPLCRFKNEDGNKEEDTNEDENEDDDTN